MSLKHTLYAFDVLDNAAVSGNDIITLFANYPKVNVISVHIKGARGSSDFIRIKILGSRGKIRGGKAPTLGIIGRLGGVGARPSRIGLVSDADGAIAAIACGLKLADMQQKGDILPGDVIITTHISPNAPTRPHTPVDFMDSPVDDAEMSQHESISEADAILSLDTTKGNRIINHKGYALSPTVKEGYILQVSEDLLRIMETTSGRRAVTFPITMQDITPYNNGIHHINSILQPSISTSAPVVGVAICTESVVPGCATGASHETDITSVVKFAIEVAKEFGSGACNFYDADEYAKLFALYGSMSHLQSTKQYSCPVKQPKLID